jgi:hypothetical protein
MGRSTMKQKAVVGETSSEIPEDAALFSVGEDNSRFTHLADSMVEIGTLNGVLGYTLRNSTSAIVDLEEEKLTDFALLANHIHEYSTQMAVSFELNDIESILIEGKDAKVLSLTVGETKLDILMERSADHFLIGKRLLFKEDL